MTRVRFSLVDGLLMAALGSIVLLGLISSTGADENAESFATPEAAATALVKAAKTKDAESILAILGPDTKEWITSGDPVQDRKARERFVSAFETKHAIEIEGDDTAILAVGKDGFPFPFPIVKKKAGWVFDPEQGREELLSRRIGANELNTIQVLRAIADAQREYASEDRDGDGLGAYASRFRSTEGKQDGLYWPTEANEAPSPLGPLIATASAEGYVAQKKPEESEETGAYHGYQFKLLKRQGPDAPGGAYDYMVGDKMFGGFAAVAWPAKYGASGIMTFMISHDGKIHESNLGPETGSIVRKMETFNPGKGWTELEAEEASAPN